MAFCFDTVYAILPLAFQAADGASAASPSSYERPLILLEVNKDMECNVEKNLAQCPCTYEPCSKKGKCCECIRYHMRMNELPGCLFPPEAERTYDRSIAYFVRLHS